MGDTRFDRCILLAKISPDALDWPNFPREWRTPDFLLLARLRQRCLCLAIRSGTMQRVLVPSCNSSTWSSSSKQQKKQAAAVASSSCKTSPADVAHAGMAPCRRLTQTGLASYSLLRISTATIRPATAAASARTIGAKVLIFAATRPYSSRLNLALVVAVELRLRCWPGGYGDTKKTTGCHKSVWPARIWRNKSFV